MSLLHVMSTSSCFFGGGFLLHNLFMRNSSSDNKLHVHVQVHHKKTKNQPTNYVYVDSQHYVLVKVITFFSSSVTHSLAREITFL